MSAPREVVVRRYSDEDDHGVRAPRPQSTDRDPVTAH